jgi:hypothetical protein
LSNTVEVAVFNVALGPDYDLPVPYRDLLRTDVNADDSTPLADLLSGALDELRKDADLVPLTNHGYYLAFARPAADMEPVPWGFRFQQSYYGVTSDGLLAIYGTDLSGMTVGDLRRAGEAGEIDGDWNRIVIIPPEGLGGPGDLVSPFLDFLNAVGIDLAAGAVIGGTGYAVKRAKDKVGDRPARKAAQAWAARGIAGPWEISRWIDRRDSWDETVVAKRLGIPTEAGRQLLEAIGYQPHPKKAATWVVGTTTKAKKRRKQWDKAESRAWQGEYDN